MATKRICKICREREATCPDRTYENIGRRVLEICSDCHSNRLKEDMYKILLRYRDKL